MDRERLAWLRVLAVAGDAIVLGALWIAVAGARAAVGSLPPLPADVSAPLGWLIVPLWLAALGASGSYGALRRGSARDRLVRVARGVGLAVGGAAVLLFLARIPVNRSLLVGFAVLSAPAVAASRAGQAALLHALRRRSFDPHRVVIVGDPAAIRPALERIGARPAWGIEVVGRVAVGELATRLAAGPVDEVLVAAGAAGALPEVARVCEELGVPWSLDGGFLGPRTARVDLDDLDGYPLIAFRPPSDASPGRLAKRALDVVGAAALLVVAAGPLALILAAVRLQDGGPALFRQVRVGRYGRPFTMYKVRTMAPGVAGRPATPGFKPRLDPRITRLGAVLRRWSLDELPQLVNVLRGEMSLVGPRPPLPEEVDRYEPWQRRRLSVRPGLTGLWQVSGRADLPGERWIELDLEYVDRWSLALDLVVLARTVPAVVLGTGAR